MAAVAAKTNKCIKNKHKNHTCCRKRKNIIENFVNNSKKKKRKIHNNFHGLRTMKELPSAVFVIDPKTDIDVIRESKRLNIPVISIVDSDYSYELIDYPIPGNNNSILSIYFLLSIVLQALK